MLQDIWHIAEPEAYKIHFGRWNGEDEPLEAWVRNPEEWQAWQEYRPPNNEFNRPHIFSLMKFYHEPNIWLFGGIFNVVERLSDRYKVELSTEGADFIGRLKIKLSYRKRSTRVKMERFYSSFEVSEILREPYKGRKFPGYEDIDISFEELVALVRNQRSDWQAALESVKGIYLITDTRTGKRYVGSAYGDAGIWSRWCEYVETGHGGNTELSELVTSPTLDYCRKNFRFALLEQRPARVPDDTILHREAFWKRVLMTRDEQGLNRN